MMSCDIFWFNYGVELLRITKKDHTCLAGRAWWFDGCISYLRTSVHPPLKIRHFEKMTLYLNEQNFKGGLTLSHDFRKHVILENFLTLQ